MKLFVGIDGGGTKTDFMVCDETGRCLKRFQKGPGNPVDIGIERCVDLLKGGIEEIMEALPEGELCSVYAGLAGGMSGNNNKLIHICLKELLPKGTIVGNDTDVMNQMIYECAGRDAGAIVAGTGCVGISQKAGDVRMFGGYGYLLDRGGSGYDYGRDALYYALCDVDDRGVRTLIRTLVEEQIGNVRKHIPEIYAKGKPYIASFAPIVFEAYRQGDAVAEQIIQANTKELAGLFNRIAQHQQKEVCEVVLSGSVFKSFSVIEKYLYDNLQGEFRMILSDVDPVYGTVVQAAVQAGIQDIKAFKRNMIYDV